VNEWDIDFQNYLCNLKTERKKPVIIAGDLNVAHHEIDIYDPVGKRGCACFTDEERDSFQSFLDKGFVDTFRHLYPEEQRFSFWTARGPNMRKNDRGWRLDYMVINSEDMGMVVDSSIHKNFEGSDHCPVQIKLDLTKRREVDKELVEDKALSEMLASHPIEDETPAPSSPTPASGTCVSQE
jgi:exodeoxyribonuclease III